MTRLPAKPTAGYLTWIAVDGGLALLVYPPQNGPYVFGRVRKIPAGLWYVERWGKNDDWVPSLYYAEPFAHTPQRAMNRLEAEAESALGYEVWP